MSEGASKATRDDLVRSAVIPGFGVVVGIGALWRDEVRRGLSMIGVSLGVLALVVALAFGIAHYRSATSVSNALTTAGIELELQKVAHTISLNCPKMVDPNTRLDHAEAGPGKVLTFFYTFPKVSSSHVPESIFSEKVVASNLKAACHAKPLKPFFDHDITVIYSYRANDGKQLGIVKINRETCGLNKGGGTTTQAGS
jgi:hypothetical protein